MLKAIAFIWSEVTVGVGMCYLSKKDDRNVLFFR